MNREEVADRALRCLRCLSSRARTRPPPSPQREGTRWRPWVRLARNFRTLPLIHSCPSSFARPFSCARCSHGEVYTKRAPPQPPPRHHTPQLTRALGRSRRRPLLLRGALAQDYHGIYAGRSHRADGIPIVRRRHHMVLFHRVAHGGDFHAQGRVASHTDRLGQDSSGRDHVRHGKLYAPAPKSRKAASSTVEFEGMRMRAQAWSAPTRDADAERPQDAIGRRIDWTSSR